MRSLKYQLSTTSGSKDIIIIRINEFVEKPIKQLISTHKFYLFVHCIVYTVYNSNKEKEDTKNCY